MEDNENAQDNQQTGEENTISPKQVADTVLLALKNKDMQALSSYVHPTKGLLFSPYGYIVTDTAQVFTGQQVAGLLNDSTLYHWGEFDGTGDPMEMTFADYYERFVYDQDYANAEQTSINERLGQGNTIDNILDVYPGATTVEYHFSGFDPQYEGMDWRSLRIVLEEENGEWYIVAIVHDEWTI
ncbi:hypothetical protein [Caldalkalibacillus mannanilyticus]|uniref:hypothetical protein n=1 Tax=Caldalkalibacillus mannanilyticus TaxID=1418 RepID=UPI00046A4EC9|nr:hypothetical protein [Caldalkalibacillus mannanilyticus]